MQNITIPPEFSGVKPFPLLPYVVPDTFILFVGPPDCARHHCRMHFLYGRMYFLSPTDTDYALGNVEQMIFDAVNEIVSYMNTSAKGVMILTGCQGRLLCLDFDAVCAEITKRFGISAVHHSESRLHRFDDPEGCEDMCTAIMRFLPTNAGTNQKDVFVLGPLSRELNDVLTSLGAREIHKIYDMDTFSAFSRAATAGLCVITDESIYKAGKFLETHRNMKCIFAPVNFRIVDVESVYSDLSKCFAHALDFSIHNKSLAAVEYTRLRLKGQPIRLDLAHINNPWNLIKALLEYGFNIEKVSVRPEPPFIALKNHDKQWCVSNFPELKIENSKISMSELLKEPSSFYTENQYQNMLSQAVELTEHWGYSAILKLMDFMDKEVRE